MSTRELIDYTVDEPRRVEHVIIKTSTGYLYELPSFLLMPVPVSVPCPHCGAELFRLNRKLDRGEDYWKAYAQQADGVFLEFSKSYRCNACRRRLTWDETKSLFYETP